MNPILIDFPEIIAETERLYIRPCLPGDGKDVYDAVIASNDELKKWLPFAAKKKSLEETEAGIRRSYAQFWLREDIRLHIYRKEDGQFIGSTGLHRIDWEARSLKSAIGAIRAIIRKVISQKRSKLLLSLHSAACLPIELRSGATRRTQPAEKSPRGSALRWKLP